MGLTAFATFLLGIFVFLEKKRERLGIIFFLYCFSISWWSFFELIMATSSNRENAIFWGKLMQAGDIFLPTLFVHFIVILLDLSLERWKLIALYSISSFFSILCFTPLLISDAQPSDFVPFMIKAGPLYLPMVVFFGLCVFYGHLKLYKAYTSSVSYKRNQLSYLLWSSVFGYIGGSLNFLLVFDIYIPLLNEYGTYAVPLYVAATTYTIVRYQFLDIKLIINKGLAYVLLLGIFTLPTYLAIIITHQATFYSIPPLLAGTLIFACGLWIVMKKPKSIPNVTFGLVCLSVTIWLFSDFMMYSINDANKALVWAKVSYVGVPYIPAFFYHFCLSILQQQGKKRLVLANYLVSTLFALLIPTLYLVDNSLYSYFWGFYPKAGVIHPIFLVYFGLVSGLSLRKLYLGYKAKERVAPLEATRIKYLFWAFAAGFIASIDFIQNYGFEFYPTGYIFVTLWVIIVTYAISKYQLMDITLIVTGPKILAYVKPLALIPFYFGVLMLIRIFTGSYQYLLSGILVASFAIFARLLVNLQRQMERTVEKSFFRKKYDAYRTLTEFSKAIVSILDLGELTEKITSTLSKGMGVSRVSTFLLDEKAGYSIGSFLGLEDKIKRIQLKADDPLPKTLTKRGEITIKEELERDLFVDENKPLIDNMAAIEAEVSIPFISKGRLVGFCNLGNKKSRDMYSNEDLALLGNLASQAAIAIENARLHYLEKKSIILMKQIDKVDTFARFAGGMAHEINNPLVTISTFFQLLPQKRDDNEFMDSFSRLAFTETERIRRLTRELLDYGKPKQIQFRMEDLNILVTRVVLLIKLEAEKKQIAIKTVLANDLPRIHMDPDQIRQVILNILLNAIDATGEGGAITIGTRYIQSDQKEEFAQFWINDTGEGIAKEEIDKIFDPFFTTKHASIGREGTGLGLSISHQIIKEHKGFINVESTLGKGTTFLIYIPVNSISSEREERPLPIASAILDTQ
ncbi:MAG: GAF domain-containing protein [Nitrospirae bacterium]|nr:GAF domain-containing protein [Nitrospirota bacterium]